MIIGSAVNGPCSCSDERSEAMVRVRCLSVLGTNLARSTSDAPLMKLPLTRYFGRSRLDDHGICMSSFSFCGSYWSALAGWHRLASGLVRPRMDSHIFDHLKIAGPESAGESVGVGGSDGLRTSDVQRCNDSFRVRAEPLLGTPASVAS